MESWDLAFLVCHPSIPVRFLSISCADDGANKYLGKPFFTNLAAGGWLEYPLFAFSLTMNSSGTLTLGAIDASVVKNPALISWNQVVQFPPFAAESNQSSYLEWAIPISGFSVNHFPQFSILLILRWKIGQQHFVYADSNVFKYFATGFPCPL